MSLRSVRMWTVDCDGCGRNHDQDADFVAWVDGDQAVAAAENLSLWTADGGRHYCLECYARSAGLECYVRSEGEA